jgi:uncharacterized repeat protein (TIGR01451 family)
MVTIAMGRPKTIIQVVVLSRSSQLEATKTASVIDNNTSGSTDLGDTVVYTITVENKGNVTLSGVSLTDTLLDGNGSPLSLTKWTNLY